MTLEEKLYSLIDKKSNNECWKWKGSLHKPSMAGYFYHNKKQYFARKTAYKIANGEIPKNRFILTTCENSDCCNPSHLTCILTPREKENTSYIVEWRKHNSKTKEGVLKLIYHGQYSGHANKGSSKRRQTLGAPSYSKEEFIKYAMSSIDFNKLFEMWVESGYEHYKRPSCDRIDNNIGYNFENIQFVTWFQNRDKQSKSEEQKQYAINATNARINKRKLINNENIKHFCQ